MPKSRVRPKARTKQRAARTASQNAPWWDPERIDRENPPLAPLPEEYWDDRHAAGLPDPYDVQLALEPRGWFFRDADEVWEWAISDGGDTPTYCVDGLLFTLTHEKAAVMATTVQFGNLVDMRAEIEVIENYRAGHPEPVLQHGHVTHVQIELVLL